MPYYRIAPVRSEAARTPSHRGTRQTARLAIEEVLGGSRTAPVGPKFDLPASVPTVGSAADGEEDARRPRPRRRAGRGLVAAALVATALFLGAALGAGALNPRDQFNADRLAVQEGLVELYQVPEVQGHPGSGPTRARSGSIREFLGMASAF